ncbi:hypothetical protein IDT21_003124 [Escherichia coli]|nr:hypothetical protein [Escherichia coli]ELL6555250.1 hypothetical protein [Escherichia coli]
MILPRAIEAPRKVIQGFLLPVHQRNQSCYQSVTAILPSQHNAPPSQPLRWGEKSLKKMRKKVRKKLRKSITKPITKSIMLTTSTKPVTTRLTGGKTTGKSAQKIQKKCAKRNATAAQNETDT